MIEDQQIEVNSLCCLLYITSFIWLFPLSNFILPLILWLFIRHKHQNINLHGINLLNFQLTWGLGILILWGLLAMLSANGHYVLGAGLGLLLPILGGICLSIFIIIAGVMAYKGKIYQLPSYKFIR